MPALSTELRSLLDKTVQRARDAAEAGAAQVLTGLAIDQPRAFDGMSEERRALRDALRAEARRLGDQLELSDADQPRMKLLAAEVAYHHWHRMLFARFLAENNLLMHPEGVAVSLADCDDLAREEGEDDQWVVAARYAALMLPGIFRPDDPVSQLRFAPEHRRALEQRVADLPAAVFTADDSLGWVYQFWQAKAKDEINRSERKIGGADIGPVTQLFTEDYMVKFLLENSLGAWWVARHGAPPPGQTWEYLRLNDDGTPAAGAFEGWPSTAAELKVIDPCCGSGHFLVAAFDMLLAMRMAEEGLSEAAAGEAVLRDNLHGLEIDPRCTQIAAFAVALAAWKRGGYRELPLPNIACSGLAVGDRVDEWLAPAGDDLDLRAALRRLFELFREAPTLGSLIDPRREVEAEGLFAPSWEQVLPGMEEALGQTSAEDPVRAVFGEAARGATRAALLLADAYHLVCTNVPYLGQKKQAEQLRGFCGVRHPLGKADLATCFVERCLGACERGGSAALVTPQNWFFLTSYSRLREGLLREARWSVVARLGPGAFDTIGGEVVNVALVVVTAAPAAVEHVFCALDASAARSAASKAEWLRTASCQYLCQEAQLANPDAAIVLAEPSDLPRISRYAHCMRGVVCGDAIYWTRCFWEVAPWDGQWLFYQSTVTSVAPYGGREHVIDWSTGGAGMLRPGTQNEAYGHGGVAISQLGELWSTLYTGELYDNSTAPIVPYDPSHLPAVWCFCSSPGFAREVRKIDQKLNVTNATLLKVPFDLGHWQQVAAERYPDGLPEPWSDDPTQWLFHGHPARSADPLQVAVARLLGYRWPEHGIADLPSRRLRQEEDGLSELADDDGIVCLPRVLGEEPADQRLAEMLAKAFNSRPPAETRRVDGELVTGWEDQAPGWSSATLDRLLAEAGCAGWTLERWLREKYFEQHARLFHNRPFIWHIWDGRKDGFAALVNYHRLDRATLERLTYSYLNGWISVQKTARDRGEEGADGRLVAAEQLQEKLKLILAGEPPYDIYVRWKAKHEQPMGWEPDLNDGVRMNIRPFVTAGVLRSKFTINWNKDRGKNPDGSERLNDLHLTLAAKQAAREAEG